MKTQEFKMGLIWQLISFIIMIILLIISIFSKAVLPYALITAGITLLIMAYNNHETFKRKAMTILYIVFGLGVIISGILELING